MTDALTMLQTGDADLAWLQANMARLKQEYDSRFVAIHAQQILASAPSMDALLKEFKRKKIDASTVLISYVSKVAQIL